MSMLNRRLQVLIDEGRWRLLEAEADRRHVPVAVLVRDAIDLVYGGVAIETKRAAWAWLADQPDVPAPTPEEIDARLWEQASAGLET